MNYPKNYMCGEQLRRYEDTKPNCNNDYGGLPTLIGYPLAMVYAPIQEFENIYDSEKALAHGTLFGDLDLPFTAGRGIKKC